MGAWETCHRNNTKSSCPGKQLVLLFICFRIKSCWRNIVPSLQGLICSVLVGNMYYFMIYLKILLIWTNLYSTLFIIYWIHNRLLWVERLERYREFVPFYGYVSVINKLTCCELWGLLQRIFLSVLFVLSLVTWCFISIYVSFANYLWGSVCADSVEGLRCAWFWCWRYS